jgi:hypothetical protein
MEEQRPNKDDEQQAKKQRKESDDEDSSSSDSDDAAQRNAFLQVVIGFPLDLQLCFRLIWFMFSLFCIFFPIFPR